MAVYHYQGIRKDGKTVKGVVDAASVREANHRLKSDGIYPTELNESSGASSSQGIFRRGSLHFFRSRTPSEQEKIVFTRQLGSLVSAGFPVFEALQAVEGQLQQGVLRVMVAEMRSGVSEGGALSDVLSNYPHIFPRYYINLIKAGENSGSLDAVLERLGRVMEEQQRLRSKMVSAMIYPAIMSVVGIFILAFLMTVVVPGVVQVFQDSNQALPWMTRSLLWASEFIAAWGWFLGAAVILTTLLLRAWVQTRKGRILFEKLLFSLPLVHQFIQTLATFRVAQTLEMLLRSGVPMIRSIRIAGNVSGFILIEEAMDEVSRQVSKGDALAQAMRETGYFPDLMLRMVDAGETTGSLESMLTRIAGDHNEQIQRTMERVMHMVEPVIVLIMGAVVGYVVIAVLLPIFEMNQLIQ